MKFTFSIRTALRESWQSFSRHPLFFGSMAFVMVIFNLFARGHHHPAILALVIVASILWSYVWMSASLAAADGHEDLLSFGSLAAHMPSVREFFMFLAVGLLVGIISAFGFILLVVPGIYFATRLAFATLSYVDRQGSVRQSLERSWHLVNGTAFWKVLLVIVVEVGLVIGGALALMIGLLVTYPLAMLLVARLYRALALHVDNAKAAQ